MSDYTGKYTDKKGNGDCFERDKDAFDNAAEGTRARPKLENWNSSKSGFGSADNSAVDSGLKYSGGNDGAKGDVDNDGDKS
jgi:hypothetical protein